MNYTVTIYYYSNFKEVDYMEDETQAKTVIKKLKGHFARYGIPDMLCLDNEG